LDIVLILQLLVTAVIALFVAYNLLHYVLFLLVTRPRDANKIGHQLNQFEERQLVEWTPKPIDFLKHDDEKRTTAPVCSRDWHFRSLTKPNTHF
jgi:hypothetical protein